MVEITAEYLGQLRTRAVHEPSGTTLITDAPKDNEGLGQSFSPTDLLATALLTCIITIIGIRMKKGELPEDLKIKGKVIKKMASDPRRVHELDLFLQIHGNLNEKQKKLVYEIIRGCPVCLSINPTIQVNLTLDFN